MTYSKEIQKIYILMELKNLEEIENINLSNNYSKYYYVPLNN